MSLSKLEKAVKAIEFILKDRKRLVDDLSKRMDLTENQKVFIGKEIELANNVRVLIEHSKKNYEAILGKLPPQALEVEEAVVGAVILETKAHKVFEYLKPEHFYSDAHRSMYEACIRLKERGDPVDMRTVVVELRRIGKLEVVGGAYAIASVTSKVSSAANIEYHARIIIEMAIKRKLILLGGRVNQEGHDDTTDCFDILEFVEAEVKEINSWKK